MTYPNHTNSPFASTTIISQDPRESKASDSQQETSPSSFVKNEQDRHATMQSPVTSPSSAKNHLPAFLSKLYGMVGSPETDPWVHWNENGSSFIIPNSQALAAQVLGRHFKHNNFPSFVRQLNMYGFHKVPHLNHGVLQNDGLPEVWEFTNPYFRRDNPDDMRKIVRKKGEAEKARSAGRQQQSTSPLASHQRMPDPMDVAIIRAELQQVVNRQNMIKDELLRLSSSTEGLWKYALDTRVRYEQQQAKLDNVIRVLSDAFRKRPSSTSDLPSRIRGYLEAPAPQNSYPESSPETTDSATYDQGQQDVMKMLANGKLPSGFQDALQNFVLQSMSQTSTAQPSTPTSPTSPVSHESPDNLARVPDNTEQTGQVQDWLNNTNQYLDGLGIDLNPAGNVSYVDYLNGPNLAYDPFGQSEPTADMFGGNLSSLQTPWMTQASAANYAQDSPLIGQKRTLQHEDDGIASKRSRM